MLRVSLRRLFSLPWESLTPSQRELCTRLDLLRKEFDAPKVKKGWLSSLLKGKKEPAHRGLYIHGGVGQGKTVLMDMFYKKIESPKMRMHFHEFIIKVQQELHKHKTESKGDLMEVVAKRVMGDIRMLCLDEFFVNHISDAMILKPLFEKLFNMGVTVICTSNRPPDDLYLNGLNRERFLPFIPLLKANCDIFHLQAKDFRQGYNFTNASEAIDKVYFCESGDQEEPFLSEFRKRCTGEIVEDAVVKVSELRKVIVPLSDGKQAFFRFSNLCGSSVVSGETQTKMEISLGTEAFIAIANTFHTIWISQVPQFDASNETDGRLRSFILLIDVLYEMNTKVYISSHIPMLKLFGVVGIVKVAEEFNKKWTNKYKSFEKSHNSLPEKFSKEEFIKLAMDLGMSKGASNLLFEAMIPPDNAELGTQRIFDICENHTNLLNGLPATSSSLYRFDSKDESILENEFVCFRTMSRLFHMSSGNYHEAHRMRYLE